MQNRLGPVWDKRIVIHYDMQMTRIAVTVCHIDDFMKEIHSRESSHAAQNTNSFTHSNRPFVYAAIVTAHYKEANSCTM